MLKSLSRSIKSNWKRTLSGLLAVSPEDYKVYLLKDLLPLGFGPGSLKDG